MKENQVKIRALEKNDLKKVHEIFNNETTMSYWFSEPYNTLESMERTFLKNIDNNSERRFVIDFKHEIAGVVELVDINFISSNGEIQIAMDEGFQGQGIAQKAFKLAIKYAFGVLKLHKIFLYVDTKNKAAIHIYKKLGFKNEGTLKEHFYANNSYRDSYFMSLFNPTKSK